MRRPFLLFHWSPKARRAGILRHGLCPGKASATNEWRAPHVCYCKYPSSAWALSATHSRRKGSWDLWCTWSDYVGKYTTCNGAKDARASWWLTEYRSTVRVPTRRLWLVGTRVFDPKRRRLR